MNLENQTPFGAVQKCMTSVDVGKCCKMTTSASIYYLLATISFDAAENTPCKVFYKGHSSYT